MNKYVVLASLALVVFSGVSFADEKSVPEQAAQPEISAPSAVQATDKTSVTTEAPAESSEVKEEATQSK